MAKPASSGCDEPGVTKSDVQSKTAKPVLIRARSPTGTALAVLRHGFRATEEQNEFLRALEESSSDRALEKPPPRLVGFATPPIAIPNDGSRGDPFNDRGINRD